MSHAQTLAQLADRRPEGHADLSPDRAVRHVCDLRVVDVRPPDEFTSTLGHIPGAENVPSDELERAAAGWERDRPILLVCRSGRRSASAATLLARLGFTQVYNLRGGMLAWNEAGLPVERQPASGLLGLRDELFTCFVGMSGGTAEEMEPAFREAFRRADARYDAPTAAELERVLEVLRQDALDSGRPASDIDPHLDHFRAALRALS